MFLYDIPYCILKTYLEDNNKLQRTSKTIQFPDINKIYTYEKEKHGKKSLEFRLIDYLKNKNYNDIAIYYAIALAKTELLPKWSFDDIIAEIEEPTLLTDEKYKKYLQIGYKVNLPKHKQQKIALEMWKQAIENEPNFNITIAEKLKSWNNPEFKFAHNINMYEIRDALLNAFKIFEQIQKQDPGFNYDPKKYFNYKYMSNQSLNTYINALIGHITYSGAPESVLDKLSSILLMYDLDKNDKAYIKNIIKTLKDAKHILWPHEDMNITSLEDLKKYFNILSSSDEPKRKQLIKK